MAPSLHQPTKKGSHLGPASNVAKKAHSCLKPRPPPGPCPSCGIKGHWKVNCPKPPLGIQTSPPGPEQESWPSSAKPPWTCCEGWRCPGPQTSTLITSTEPRVTLTVAGELISFLGDMGATYSAMPACSRKIKVFQVSVMGFDGLVSTPQIAKPLPYTLEDTSFSHCFLLLPKCPFLFLGETFSQNSKPLLLP